jgi:16S rRNA (cytidine1402-2'-O)-methyltransferase
LVTPGTLYVVATPLGNLGDISQRARQALADVALVAAEDTRRTRVLLAHVGARPRLVSFHAHSPRPRLTMLVSTLAAGDSVALVADAGTPTISDPGANLIAEALASGFPVVPIPGPSAVAAALSVSGMNADRYIFLGFPPRRGRERRHLLQAAAESPWTVVMFESAQRIGQLLDDLAQVCGGDRRVAVARELTKVHEEVKLGSLEELAPQYRDPPRGEITLVLAGAGPAAKPGSEERALEVTERARTLLAGGASKRDVAQTLARELSMSRNEIYRLVTAL